eukprot:CAMPEP_0115142894 /NCGR_PEP_ID=MMETSP0227-20121206/60430_1 /TAXON_ID=89957 /ORGANISM="Polarella glacialis, Strain CCMP 1383" /LENGTH=66 /DNA_ID=CAMNT_0002551585 /DNA_START=10 /DNA_END=207 /DNA_ORIENTATION=+
MSDELQKRIAAESRGFTALRPASVRTQDLLSTAQGTARLFGRPTSPTMFESAVKLLVIPSSSVSAQ